MSVREPALWSLLLGYAICSFTFSLLCGLLGRTAHPLGAYQVYALAMPVWFLAGCALYRLRAPLPRMWPPTKAESLSAVAAVVILTSETLALLLPSSLVAIVAGKMGCLLLPDPTDARPWHRRLRLAGVAAVAVALASVGKPLRLLLAPLLLAAAYIVGNELKLRATRWAKNEREAKGGFFGAGQVLVLLLALSVSGFAGRFAPSAPIGNAMLWLVALASLGCGLFGLRIVLHRTRQAVAFPAYRAASLCCALCASAARGEALHWSGWLAVVLALGVVLWASGEALLRRCWRWLSAAWWLAMAELEVARRELAS